MVQYFMELLSYHCSMEPAACFMAIKTHNSLELLLRGKIKQISDGIQYRRHIQITYIATELVRVYYAKDGLFFSLIFMRHHSLFIRRCWYSVFRY